MIYLNIYILNYNFYIFIMKALIIDQMINNYQQESKKKQKINKFMLFIIYKIIKHMNK